MKPELPQGVEIVNTFSMNSEVLLVTFIIVINALWYWIKIIVKSKGYPMHLFLWHGRDIRIMKQIIDTEQSEAKRQYYRTLLYAFYATIAGLVAFVSWHAFF